MRGRNVLAWSFGFLAISYSAAFTLVSRVDPDASWSRFDALSGGEHFSRAVAFGDRSLAAWDEQQKESAPDDLNARRLAVADAHYTSDNAASAAFHYAAVLTDAASSELTDQRRVEINRRIAELDLSLGRADRAAVIAAGFLERAGDATAGGHDDEDHLAEHEKADDSFAELVDSFRPAFVDVLPADGSGPKVLGGRLELLRAAEAMTKVGGYYALASDGAYAAAGLLAAAHDLRETQLGPDHEDTVQTALLLAPIYERIDRLSDAEHLYEQVFQAQERAKGSNNPELSLYIRLLAGVYEKQGRLTEAEALNRHMRQIFRDAFGARRYAANRSRDRSFEINRPVSGQFRLDGKYVPKDLVPAVDFGIPLSKSPRVEEMRIRRAAFDGTSLPEQLSLLIKACNLEGERLSLRSGYRSHATQSTLHDLNNGKGTVAHPGTSEHQLGLAVDIDVNRRFMRATDRSYSCFETKAWQFGFILSFPPGNTYLDAEDPYEPWHWRYVGKRTALLYREIGPWGQPQEFLAALPCYEERALSGLFLDRERGDICIEQLQAQLEQGGRDT
ncbi:MAG: D-alanyl-D-alanine carboxypeptidase family protein [Parvularculaceae bacterium]|nr:D-alanyl-D-alanine carboxypeptidase family protein [Parvularculaceae bacterium]